MCDGSPTQYGVPHNDFLKKKNCMLWAPDPCANTNENRAICTIPKKGPVDANMGANWIVWIYVMIS